MDGVLRFFDIESLEPLTALLSSLVAVALMSASCLDLLLVRLGGISRDALAQLQHW